MTDDFFCNRFDQTIDLRNPLVVLVNLMLWHEIEAAHAQCWACQLKAGMKIEDLDLIGPVSDVARGSVSNAGRPGLPIRLMEAPLYLTHAFNESDEEVIQRRGVTPTWQYFSGDVYFEFQWPCEPTPLGRLRKSLVEEGVVELLARTMEVAVTLKEIAKKKLTRLIVDSMVQVKAVADLTDIKLHETVRSKVVEVALGYRGVDNDKPDIEIKHPGKNKWPMKSADCSKEGKHLNADHRMDRCYLKGAEGDAFHAVLCALGFNKRWLLWMIAKEGMGLLLGLLKASGLTGLIEKMAEIIGCNRLQNSGQHWALA